MTIAMGVSLFQIVFCIYLLSSIFYIGYLFNSKSIAGKLATVSLCSGWILHTITLVVRTIAAGRPPFLNLYEYVISLTWGVVLVYLVTEFGTKKKELGAFAIPLVALFSFFATRLPSELNPTMPALMSAWRVPHIVTAILAYSSFALAFCLSIMYLIREAVDKKSTSFWSSRIPPVEVLDKMIYRAIAFGFLMQTALLITGAIWAQFAWGRYWGWDPKETWALITWLIYAAFLHMRTTMGWRGRKAALVCLIGFVVTMFTLVGVNFLLSGLHSYAS